MARRSSFNPLAIERQLRAAGEHYRNGAEAIVREFAFAGEKQMEQIIEDSVTKTGLQRATDGGQSSEYGSTSPGRIDSGEMVNQVSAEWEVIGDLYIGRFGWTKEVEAYFLLQENGTAHIEAMNALHGAAVDQREDALRKLSALARTGRFGSDQL